MDKKNEEKDAIARWRLITNLSIVILFLAFCCIYLIIDITTTNKICAQITEGRVDDIIDKRLEERIDEELEEFLLENYDFEVVRQDGHGINIYNGGDGTVSVPQKGE